MVDMCKAREQIRGAFRPSQTGQGKIPKDVTCKLRLEELGIRYIDVHCAYRMHLEKLVRLKYANTWISVPFL